MMRLQVFKNGYALVSRNYDLPAAGDGKASFSLGEPPKHACHGTVWLTTGKQTTVLGTRTNTSTSSTQAICSSLPSLLRANKGCRVQVKLRQGELRTGSVVDVAANDNGLVFLDSQDVVAALPLQDVMEVCGTDGQFRHFTDKTEERRDVVVDYLGAGGPASMVHLRTGFCWAPSYHWQLHEGNRATLSGNAIVMNESEEGGVFEKLQCVVGVPNMKYGQVQDPFLVAGSISNFLAEMTGNDSPGVRMMQPPQFQMQMQMQQLQSSALTNCIQQALPAGGPVASDDEFVDVSPEGLASGAEDVHFLEFANVRLDPQARLSLPIFTTEAAYADVFRASVSSSSSSGPGYQHNDYDASNNTTLEVWRALRLVNHTSKPWTTAPVMITKDGSFIAQGMVHYTPVGAETLVNVTKALNVSCKYVATVQDTQVSERLLGVSYGVRHNSIVITVNNGKPVDIELVVDFSTTGQLLDSTPPPKKNVEVPSARPEYELNRKRDLQFVIKVAAKGTANISFRCKLLYPLPRRG